MPSTLVPVRLGRRNGQTARASDIILVMMAGLLVIVAAFKILQG
ncbi:hypothetical protein [Rhizobium ruizarguesonis]|nr:hypothetical protein [Rhizobium ruizarguesonis]